MTQLEFNQKLEDAVRKVGKSLKALVQACEKNVELLTDESTVKAFAFLSGALAKARLEVDKARANNVSDYDGFSLDSYVPSASTEPQPKLVGQKKPRVMDVDDIVFIEEEE